MTPHTFTAVQNQVLVRIVEGDTLQQAAEAAGVHRNTVLNWRRTSTDFQSAWESIHYERAMHWRDQVLPLAPLAVDAIRQILEDPATKPALRFRVALAIQKIVSTPPALQPEPRRPVNWDSVLSLAGRPNLLSQTAAGPVLELPELPEPAAAAPQQLDPPQQPEPLDHAQLLDACSDREFFEAANRRLAARKAARAAADAQSCTMKPVHMHNSAQSAPKVGRNEPCPCGSSRKFKQCCLGKAIAA